MMKRKQKHAQSMGSAHSTFLGYAGRRKSMRRFEQLNHLHRRVFHLAGTFYFDWDVQRDTIAYSVGWPQELYMVLPRSGMRCYLDENKEASGGILSVFRDALENQSPASRNYEVIRDDREVRWYRVNQEMGYDDAGKLCRVLAVFTDITDLRKKQLELYAQTQKDSLTNLYNKASTEEMISLCIGERREELHALFFIDIDNFKVINDSLGHLRGDYLLEWLSDELRSLFRSQDVLGRVGGDEFIVFCVNIRQREDAMRKAGEIIRRMWAVQVDPNNLYQLSVSIGIAICDGDSKNFLKLYEEADLALYEAKRRGKNQYAFYSDAMKSAPLKRVDG